ncbi:hypothetical protein KDW37_00420 [Burkholderia cenocepacia]|uniref:hypothetical protein n=1 Tax=Burkholderia cenocepacia TaxID=95486 RepID=UPI001B9E9942|nr:hypothetical protein [Burkholderia cenocepacia]MBR8429178.1 hypothetical protein [Burkholderia cenocepacia]
MDHHDRARLIQHKQRATLHEAAYLVTTSLGGTWDDAVSLLVDWVQTNRLLADVVPRIDPWSGKETAPIDPSKATVTVADLKALLETMTTRTGDVISDIGPQHVADMAEISNNGKCIDWVYWAGKMPRWSVAHAVRLMAALDPESFPDLSLKRNDSAGAAKEHARRLERLATAHHMAEATPAEWLQWADGLNESVHIGMRLAVERQRGIGGAPADGYELRYQAIGEDARFALFNVAELTAWASANKVAIPFLKLLVTDEHTDISSERRFQPCGTLPLLIATAYVPVDMDPHEAKGELFASGDAADDGDPVGRLRGRIAASYERHLLNAVYDGKLTIYGRTDYAPIDLTAARLRWKEKSTPRTPQEAPEEPKPTSQGDPSTPVSEVPTHHAPTEQSPAPLATPVIASAFDGIYSWSANQWSKALGDGRTLWLNKARKAKGRPGVGPATWSPITIALGLRDKGVGWVALDSVFKKAALREWREQWERETEILRD